MQVLTATGFGLRVPGYCHGLMIEPGSKEFTVTLRDAGDKDGANGSNTTAPGGAEVIFGPVTFQPLQGPKHIDWSGLNGGFGRYFGRGVHVTISTSGTGGSVSVIEP